MDTKQQLNKEFLLKQISDSEAMVKRNQGVIDFCQWMLSNLEIGTFGSGTVVAAVPLTPPEKTEIVLG